MLNVGVDVIFIAELHNGGKNVIKHMINIQINGDSDLSQQQW